MPHPDHEETRPPHQRLVPRHVVNATYTHCEKSFEHHLDGLAYLLSVSRRLLYDHHITSPEAHDAISPILNATINDAISLTLATVLRDLTESKTIDVFTNGLGRALYHSFIASDEDRAKIATMAEHITDLYQLHYPKGDSK